MRAKAKPSKSERTPEEKAAARAEHADRIRAALAELEAAEGMAAYLVADFIHGGELSAGNAALVGYQAPGQFVRRYGAWKYTEGRQVTAPANVYLTGGSMFPVANWSGDRVGMDRPEYPTVDRATCEGLARSWRDWPGNDPGKSALALLMALNKWRAEVGPAFIEGGPDGIEVGQVASSPDAEIPF